VYLQTTQHSLRSAVLLDQHPHAYQTVRNACAAPPADTAVNLESQGPARAQPGGKPTPTSNIWVQDPPKRGGAAFLNHPTILGRRRDVRASLVTARQQNSCLGSETRPPRGGARCVSELCTMSKFSLVSRQVAGAVCPVTRARSQGHSESSRDLVTCSRSPDVVPPKAPIPTNVWVICGPGRVRWTQQVFNSSF
jgi:hypothetical protein